MSFEGLRNFTTTLRIYQRNKQEPEMGARSPLHEGSRESG